jgi:hypothetical protein
MINPLRGLGPALLAILGWASPLAAQYYPAQQGQSQSAACMRLEGQLAALSRGGDPARAEQIRRYEEAVARQQAELDRTTAQSRRLGCDGLGFFSLFTGQGPQCAPLTAQIQQQRGNLDRSLSELERLRSGNDQSGQRQALIGQLAQNDCGPQYRAAATGPRGFFDALFGGGTIVNPAPAPDGAPAGTYRTVCVRTCDGYYFPISYSTVPGRFQEDQRACQRMCPASEVVLYSYRNPGEDMQQAVSLAGQLYTELPNAFRYRKEFNAACSCRKAGQSWADALRNADDRTTLERGDIVVTQDRAKALSQPPGSPGRKIDPRAKPDAAAAAPAAPVNNAAEPDPANRAVRTVGPPFLPAR